MRVRANMSVWRVRGEKKKAKAEMSEVTFLQA